MSRQWPDPQHPQQAHLDFDVDDLAAAEQQVLAIGAVKSDVQPGGDFTVFKSVFDGHGAGSAE